MKSDSTQLTRIEALLGEVIAAALCQSFSGRDFFEANSKFPIRPKTGKFSAPLSVSLILLNLLVFKVVLVSYLLPFSGKNLLLNVKSLGNQPI